MPTATFTGLAYSKEVVDCLAFAKRRLQLLLYNIDPDQQIKMMPETVLVRKEGKKGSSLCFLSKCIKKNQKKLQNYLPNNHADFVSTMYFFIY